MVPGRLIPSNQYKVPQKNTKPKKYPIKNLSFTFLFSKLKSSGTNAIQAKNLKLKIGKVKIKSSAEMAGSTRKRNLLDSIFRNIFYILTRFRKDKARFFRL